jgi:hypothetical protein
VAEHGLAVIPAGLAVGALTGAAARAWMRLVSTEPEFTWSGTTFVVGVFAFAGLTQGLALAARGRRWRWWPQLPIRLLAAFGAMLLGGGAGIIMLPAIVTGSVAAARSDWPRAARLAVGGIAAVNALALLVVLSGEPLGWRIPAGWLAMLALYAVIIGGVSLNLRPLAGGPSLRTRSTAIVAGVLATVAAAFAGLSVLGV